MKLIPLLLVVISANEKFIDRETKHNQYLWKDLHTRVVGWRKNMFESDAQKGIEHSETIKQWIALAQRSYDKMKKTVGRGYPQLACDIEKSQNAATCMKDGRFCGKDNWLEIKY